MKGENLPPVKRWGEQRMIVRHRWHCRRRPVFNSDATKRRKLVQALLGTASGADPNRLVHRLGELKQFEAVFANQQYTPYTILRITPHFERDAEPGGPCDVKTGTA
jgi:hypothetical protein